tara:strand:+ start:404 stop:622 length:219 start_codon:yes stop_codon:yes gene_type:complete
MEYKFTGYYFDGDMTYYHFKPIGDRMNTEIKIGWGHMGSDNMDEYLEDKNFESIEEIWTVIRYGSERYKENK